MCNNHNIQVDYFTLLYTLSSNS